MVVPLYGKSSTRRDYLTYISTNHTITYTCTVSHLPKFAANPGPDVVKHVFMLNSTEHDIIQLIHSFEG